MELADEAWLEDVESPALDPLEVCILGSNNEDEVQTCLQEHDLQSVSNGDRLENCLADATTSDDYDECAILKDKNDEHCYG